MKKNGFTLIELVGSVVILALIALIAFPALTSMLSSGNDKIDNATKAVLESAALEYYNDNIDNDLTEIDGCTLVEKGYISMTFYKKNKSVVDGSIFKSSNHFKYETGGAGDCLEGLNNSN